MQTLKIGDMFAGVRITDLCGQGGCGTVYLAEDAVGERVAVKIINTPDQQRELRGVQAYMKIMRESPHLLQIRHVGIEQDTLFYVMPACDPYPGVPGYLPDTLGSRLKFRGRLDPETVLDIVRKIASAVAVLHRAGLLHRDIKPDNIIFIHGEPVLSDPGLICSLDLSVSLAGSLGFLPPECFAGKENNSKQSDIYALGKVFYCAVTGLPPGVFPKLPRDLSSPVCRRLLPVVLRACNEKKKRRFDDIAEFQKSLPARLPKPGPLARRCEEFRTWRLMHSTLWRTILAGIVLVIGAAGFGAYHAAELRRRHAEEVRTAAASVQAFSQDLRKGRARLELQLERLTGEAKTRGLLTRFDRLPANPIAAQKVCGELRDALREAARKGFAEAWKISDPLRCSGEVRSLLGSPLGAFPDKPEIEAERARLAAYEEAKFPNIPFAPRPGETASPDSSKIFTYAYIPPGEYVSPTSGKKCRIDYPFWVQPTELTVRQFSILGDQVPSGNGHGDRPVRRILWNDLLTACSQAMSMHRNTGGGLPPGYIVRPLTEAEWEYCASAGQGVCRPDENAWCREKPFKTSPSAGSLPPNAFGLHDLMGGQSEFVLADRRTHPDSVVLRGGSWKTPRAALPTVRKELVFFQLFYDEAGARLAIAPGTPDLLTRKLRSGTPNHFVHNGKHYEFFGHLAATYSREAAEEVCRSLGGRLASIDTEELREKTVANASPVIEYLVCVGAVFRDGKWMWTSGVPVKDAPPAPGPKQRFVMENGKFGLTTVAKYLGFVCEWTEDEWRARAEWRARMPSKRILTEFTLGDRHYVLFRHSGFAFPHLLRRYAEILGGKLAEPESAELQTAIAEKTRDFQSDPTMLGGICRIRDFYWLTSGNRIGEPLPLVGRQVDNAPSLATPAMLNGKLCSAQFANRYLVEFPARSPAR